MNEKLFRTESLNKVNNPDKTDAYLKVTNPSIWLIIFAAIILLGSFAYWSFAATIPNRTPAVGYIKDQQVTVFMPAENVMAIGDSLEILIDGVSHAVTGVETKLYSAKEIKDIYGEAINPSEMNFVITAEAKGMEDGIKSLSVVTNRVRAFDYMLQQSNGENNG